MYYGTSYLTSRGTYYFVLYRTVPYSFWGTTYYFVVIPLLALYLYPNVTYVRTAKWRHLFKNEKGSQVTTYSFVVCSIVSLVDRQTSCQVRRELSWKSMRTDNGVWILDVLFHSRSSLITLINISHSFQESDRVTHISILQPIWEESSCSAMIMSSCFVRLLKIRWVHFAPRFTGT